MCSPLCLGTTGSVMPRQNPVRIDGTSVFKWKYTFGPTKGPARPHMRSVVDGCCWLTCFDKRFPMLPVFYGRFSCINTSSGATRLQRSFLSVGNARCSRGFTARATVHDTGTSKSGCTWFSEKTHFSAILYYSSVRSTATRPADFRQRLQSGYAHTHRACLLRLLKTNPVDENEP